MFKEFIHEKRMLYLLLLYDKYLYVQLLGQKKDLYQISDLIQPLIHQSSLLFVEVNTFQFFKIS